jgi:hypothetical protein
VADLGEDDAYEDGLQQHRKDALDAHQPSWQPAVANSVGAIACAWCKRGVGGQEDSMTSAAA